MVAPASRLVSLLRLVDHIPAPPAEPPGRGRPAVYPGRLFLKALVVMRVRHLSNVHELLTVLDEATPEMVRVRALLTEGGRHPCCRTGERRLAGLLGTLPARVACLERCLVERLRPWRDSGRAVALDSTLLRTAGGV